MLTFLQLVISLVHIQAAFFTLPLQGQVMRELTLVSLGALALLEEGTEHRLGVHTCGKGVKDKDGEIVKREGGRGERGERKERNRKQREGRWEIEETEGRKRYMIGGRKEKGEGNKDGEQRKER